MLAWFSSIAKRAIVCLTTIIVILGSLTLDTTLTDAIPNFEYQWPYEKANFHSPRQSPIDLVTSKAVSLDLPPLQISQTNLQGHRAKFYNSGRSVVIFMTDRPKTRPRLMGGPLLNDKFYFEQMHFHWGSEDIWGSEHFIDGESFAAEIHLVHWNSKYGTFNNASTKHDGLAVLTIFAEDNHIADNPLLKPLSNLLANITDTGSYVMLDTNDAMQWAISALVENSEYYTYPGSLTTEPYSENVVFILLPKPISLSCEQLHAFRTIHSSTGKLIVDNKRRLQPLHHRPIVRVTLAGNV